MPTTTVIKLTKEQRSELQMLAVDAIHRKYHRFRVIAAMESFPGLPTQHPATYLRIYEDAQAEIRLRHQIRTGEDQRETSIDLYESIIRDEASTLELKVECQKAIDRVLGLGRPLLIREVDAIAGDLEASEWIEREIERRIADRLAERIAE